MNAIERANDLMTKLVKQKENDLLAIENHLNDCRDRMSKAQQDKDAAAAALDGAAFAAADSVMHGIETEIKMYEARRKQIISHDLIGEDENEAIIDSLLSYEATIADEFKKAIAPHLDALEKIRAGYAAEVDTTENTLRNWTSQIRPTYINRNGKSRFVDGKYTNRFDSPQPVRVVEYRGCEASGALGKLLDAVKRSMK